MTAQEARQVDWICPQCAYENGAKPFKKHLATFHLNTCGVCRKEKQVTEPRDFDWRGIPQR